MKVKELTTFNKIEERINNFFNDIKEKDINDLSNQEISWVKCVSFSSIKSMRDKGKDNEYILTTFQNNIKPENIAKKKEKVAKALGMFSDEELASMGIKRL